MMFEVIEGTKQEKPDYQTVYQNAFIRSKNIKQFIFYGVKLTNIVCLKKPSSLQEAHDRMTGIMIIVDFMKQLTPAQMLTIFPVQKIYDGDRWQTKDYFYTMKTLEAHGMDAPIGEAVHDILWDYMNWETRMFVVHTSSTESEVKLHKWMEDNGITSAMREASSVERCLKIVK